MMRALHSHNLKNHLLSRSRFTKGRRLRIVPVLDNHIASPRAFASGKCSQQSVRSDEYERYKQELVKASDIALTKSVVSRDFLLKERPEISSETPH